MKCNNQNCSGEIDKLINNLETAHSSLISARKIAALNKLESFEEIGDAIECVEAALVWHTN
jgi:hypothetical protein